ncbi:hypothetical protein BD780_000890 [Clostridium tetanomorphum]|uniref:hypothetical protein n=1 Tax=Clostridium tetanomorphum TaxID=1553 RepID=UPI000448BC1C|nr:hypothetical protein [Clostridium tetanomorphum]KAJ49223.1 hypothetical protein CTM_24268 [Clostridium tetanomorphum DSM 665]KAJ49524.1 hypothetical protein CTM_22666 [Clostridium tetanomorphum DSM 665]MBP1864217.1 hypothetical protein [Clostridium tetanomorphum]NRS83665.1 hypothetical protein [Clostridium tetanomorphum]SQC02074.1 Uncharacterised protein [Clostridium tetanomorphum]
MNKNRPFIITFIGDVSFLGALLSILIALLPSFAERLEVSVIPVPFFSEGITQVLLPIILLIASYGFLKLKRWGYWLMTTYTIFFLLVNIIWYLQNKHSFHSPNFILKFIELIFILPTKKYFYEEKISS